jgi:hypothetical protein
MRQQSQDYNKYNEIIKRLSTKQGNELVLKDVSTTDRAFLKEFSPLNDSFLSYYFLSSSEVARNEVLQKRRYLFASLVIMQKKQRFSD